MGPALEENQQSQIPSQGANKKRWLIAICVMCMVLTLALELTTVVDKPTYIRSGPANGTKICSSTRQIQLSKGYFITLCVYPITRKDSLLKQFLGHIPTSSKGVWLVNNFSELVKVLRGSGVSLHTL